jgi:large conductance mechanosensitive channel
MTDYAALKKAGAPVLGWGEFITQVVSFLILAFIIFLIVRAANRMTATPEAAPAEPEAEPADVALLREIRDELRKKPA